MLVINSTISIPMSEFDISYARSPGPGGQNVNKVNSKVILRWDVTNTKRLPEHVRKRFLVQWASRVTKSGHVVIHSHRFRDQPRNYTDCMNKVREMISHQAFSRIQAEAAGEQKAEFAAQAEPAVGAR